MEPDKLKTWLQEADAAAGGPRMGRTDLPVRVRQRVARRRTRQRVAGAAVLVMALGGALAGWPWWRQAPPAEPRMAAAPGGGRGTAAETRLTAADGLRLQAEVARLQQQAHAGQVLAVRLQALERSAQVEAAWQHPPEALRQIEQQVERAALILVYQADQMRQDDRLREQARRQYQEAVQMFPQTRWAQVARTRLAQMGS